MIKQKLINTRKQKGFTQEQMAFNLGIEQSQYNRRENGNVEIPKSEWAKIAKILDVPFEEVYEPHDGVFIINSKNTNSNFDNYIAQSEYAFETLKKYIIKLEKENQQLSKENETFKRGIPNK